MSIETTPEARRITMIALMIVLLLSALDQTVVSTAMPRVVAQLKGLNLYAWVSTIYLLTSTVMVPIWGKLGDLYGRKRVLIAGVLIFVAGSWLCGLSGEVRRLPLVGGGMTQLIIFRGLQGIGGGALFTSAFGVMADLYPPRERGKFAGYFGAAFGLASVLGPVIGGFLTDQGTTEVAGFVIEGWRWCFYVNLPLSILALFMIMARMPALGQGRGGRIDWLGALLTLTSFSPLLLALSWGGHDYPWSSPRVLGLFAVSAVSLALFVVVEQRATEPILPLDLFANRTFSAANGAAFVISMAFMGTIIFLPLYLQLGLGIPATQSGLVLLPMMLGLIMGATVSGRLVTRTGRYKPFMLGGAVLVIVGLLLLIALPVGASPGDITWRVFVFGLGLGPNQGLFSLAVQNAVPVSRLGVATSSAQFFRQIGGTVGAAIFGAVLTGALGRNMAQVSPPGSPPLTLDSLQALAVRSAAGAARIHMPYAVEVAFGHAMAELFWAGLAITVLGVIGILLIPELPLRARAAPSRAEPFAEPGEGVAADSAGDVSLDGPRPQTPDPVT